MKAKTVFFSLIIWGGSVSLPQAQIRSDFVLVPEGEQPHVLIDRQNRLHATWWNHGIYYGLFDSLGNSLQSQLVSANTPSETSRLSISDRFFAVVWTGYLPGFYSHIRGVLLNRENGLMIGDFENFNGNSGYPDVKFLTDSTFITVWSGDGPYTPYPLNGIYGQVLTITSNAVGDTLWFTDDLPKQYMHYHPRIVKDRAYGDTYILWISQDTLSSRKVFGRRISENGKLSSSSLLISESSNYSKAWGLSTVLDESGNLIVVWSAQVGDSSWNVYLRRFNTQNFSNDMERKISEEPAWQFSEVDLAIDKNGNHVVVWDGKKADKSKIIAQRFAPDGTHIGENFSISVHTDTIDKFAPSVVLKHGRIYTAWTASVSDSVRRGTIWANILDFDNPIVNVNPRPNNPSRSFHLFQNYPNPFNPSTNIQFSLPAEDLVILRIYNLQGQLVRELLHEQRAAGVHTATWDGRNDRGSTSASGIYFLRLESGTLSKVSRLTLLR